MQPLLSSPPRQHRRPLCSLQPKNLTSCKSWIHPPVMPSLCPQYINLHCSPEEWFSTSITFTHELKINCMSSRLDCRVLLIHSFIQLFIYVIIHTIIQLLIPGFIVSIFIHVLNQSLQKPLAYLFVSPFFQNKQWKVGSGSLDNLFKDVQLIICRVNLGLSDPKVHFLWTLALFGEHIVLLLRFDHVVAHYWSYYLSR